MAHKGSRRRNPSKSSYHKKVLKNARKRDDYTPASEVTIIDANSGEVIDRVAPLGEKDYERVVAKGSKRANPTSRAAVRRNYGGAA